MANEFFLYLAAFLIVSVLFAYFLKKKFKTENFLGIITLIKTQKANPYFDKIAKWGKPLDYLADLGIVLGFGALAIDFLWGRKQPLAKRIALFAFSFALLSTICYFTFGSFLKNSPITAGQEGLFSIAFGLFGFAGFAVVAISSQAIHIIEKLWFKKCPLPGVAPVIPGVQLPNVPIFVPLHGWISFLIILVLHEGFHGVIARREGLKVKSSGLLLLGFLPIGAFVEPDDEEIKQTTDRKKLRLFASGAMANLVFTFVLVMLLGTLWAGVIAPPFNQVQRESVIGIRITEVTPTTEFECDFYPNSAYGVLEPGMKILKVNGVSVLTNQEFQDALSKNSKAVGLTVETQDGRVLEKTFEKNKFGYIGIKKEGIPNPSFVAPKYYGISLIVLDFFSSFFFWLLLLSFLVGFINFLPMNPFDGGKIASTILTPYFGFTNWPKELIEKRVNKTLFYALLLVLAVNALPLFIP